MKKFLEVLQDILNASNKTSDVIVQVAAASEQQSSAAEQISKSVESINAVTQESAQGIHQIARAADDLSKLTVNLQDMVSRFKLNNSVKGHASMMSLSSKN